jgi:hypothetical protein
MLQEMKLLQLLGKKQEYLLREYLFFQKNIIGGAQVLFDLVVQIQRFFIGFEIQNFLLKVLM